MPALYSLPLGCHTMLISACPHHAIAQADFLLQELHHPAPCSPFLMQINIEGCRFQHSCSWPIWVNFACILFHIKKEVILPTIGYDKTLQFIFQLSHNKKFRDRASKLHSPHPDHKLTLSSCSEPESTISRSLSFPRQFLHLSSYRFSFPSAILLCSPFFAASFL